MPEKHNLVAGKRLWWGIPICLAVLGLAGCQAVGRAILNAHLSADDFYAQAQLKWNSGEYRLVQQDTRDALRKQPNHYGALMLLGDADVQIAAISMSNNKPNAQKPAGHVPSDFSIRLTQKEEADLFDEGMREYRVAAQLQPAQPDPHSQMARIWDLKGDRGRAVAQYREALRLHAPDAPLVHVKIGRLLKQDGDRSGALAEFEEAKRLLPDYPRFNEPGFKREVERLIDQTR